MNITRRQLFLLSVGALLSVAAVELFAIVKDGTLISIFIDFPNTSASIKLLLFSSICFVIMIIILFSGYTNVFTWNNLTRIATAALGISLTTHAAISGPRLDFAEGVILGVIVLLLSLYSLIEVYTALKISPKQHTLGRHSYSESRITPDALRAYLDSSKVSYENLTGELRKRGIVFKKRDLTADPDFVAATNALQAAGIDRLDKLDNTQTKANYHVDKIPFMLQQEKGGSTSQTKLIEIIAELHKKELI